MTSAFQRDQLQRALYHAGIDMTVPFAPDSPDAILTRQGGNLVRGIAGGVRLITMTAAEIDAADGDPDGDIAYMISERGLSPNRISIIAVDEQWDRPISGTAWVMIPWRDLIEGLLSGRHAFVTQLLSRNLRLRHLNPYQSVRAVETDMFFGRRDDLADLATNRDSYYVVGPRRSGKTSLVKAVERELRESPEYRVQLGGKSQSRYLNTAAYVDLNLPDNLEQVWELILRQMGLEQRDLAGGMGFKLPLKREPLPVQRSSYELLAALLRSKYQRALLILDEVDAVLALDEANGWGICQR